MLVEQVPGTEDRLLQLVLGEEPGVSESPGVEVFVGETQPPGGVGQSLYVLGGQSVAIEGGQDVVYLLPGLPAGGLPNFVQISRRNGHQGSLRSALGAMLRRIRGGYSSGEELAADRVGPHFPPPAF